MMKKGHKRKNWTERWFVLKPNIISYYVSEDLKDKKGDIMLDENCCVEVSGCGLSVCLPSAALCCSLLSPGRQPHEWLQWSLAEMPYLHELQHGVRTRGPLCLHSSNWVCPCRRNPRRNTPITVIGGHWLLGFSYTWGVTAGALWSFTSKMAELMKIL